MTHNMIFAKSDGTSLSDHSKLVEKIVNVFQRISPKIADSYKDFFFALKVSALLHDIGKCTSFFQKKLKTEENPDDNKNKKIKFTHAELGAAFCWFNLDCPKNIKEVICNSIYWHHGIYGEMSTNDYEEIFLQIEDVDRERMRMFLIEILKDYPSLILHEFDKVKNEKTPIYFSSIDKEFNMISSLMRAYLISADRIASQFGIAVTESEIVFLIENYINLNKNLEILPSENIDLRRLALQQQIVENLDKMTTIIKAPAGSGKTILGILSMLKINKKLIWVCPRNTVAISVYNNIIGDLKLLGLKNLSVELYLTSERKKCTDSEIKDFESDIVVTNIDNFLAPTTQNSHAGKSFRIFNSAVIFDEYHELVNKNALMSAFTNIMRVRHQLIQSTTILLSATPIDIAFLWDSVNIKTKHLPNKDTHYPAIHNQPYKIECKESLCVSKLPTNSLMIHNSIKNVQLAASKTETNHIIHSLFNDSDKENKLKDIYLNYGKNIDRASYKPSIIGSPIIECSFDVSFNQVLESILSPESTLQRLGRCNRFGDNIGESTFISFYDTNLYEDYIKSENALRDIIYTRELSIKWFNFFKKECNKKNNILTLDEIYALYNMYCKINASEIKRFIEDSERESLRNLEKIYPQRFFTQKKKSDIKTAGSNKLRTTNSEIFVIYQTVDGEGYSDAFTRKVMGGDYGREFDEDRNSLTRILKHYRIIQDSKDNRFNYSDILTNKKYQTIDSIRKYAKKSNTPYISFQELYHPKYGVIKKRVLGMINN